jgi:uncharacterized protein (TIGR03437 family)
VAHNVCGVIALGIVLCACAAADQSANVTLAVNQPLSLDAGPSATDDISWNGAELSPLGRAQLFSLGKYGARVFKAIHARSAAAAKYSANPIPSRALVPGEIFGVRTNNGSFAKVLVTAAEGGSLTLTYTTFGSNAPVSNPLAFGPPPFPTAIQNNYSYLLPGAPNYGIAPGTLFVVEGQNLSTVFTPVLQSSAAPGLPLTLSQTSLSVTVNGVTTTPALYYVSSGAVAAVLPSTTPVGTGVLTLNSNGQNAQMPIQVVATAIGLDTLYGNGAGAGVATDASFNLLSFANAAKPGQTITLWGSGVGADPGNDDRTYPQTQNNLTGVPVQAFIGGLSATVLYRGRSAYPGLDQMNVVVPSNVSPGCFVSVVLESNLIVSNTVTIPVSANGGTCTDPALGLSGAQLQTLAAKGTTPVKSLALTLSQQTNLAGKLNDGAVVISSSVAGALFGSGNYYSSQGSCVVFQPGIGFPFQAPLDAGSVQLAGPAGNLTLQSEGGVYVGQLASNSLATNPGSYTFTGSGGKDVGAFKVNITVPAIFSLSNQAGLASMNRAQGVTVAWSGGPPTGDVMVNAVGASPNGSINIYCHAPSNAGQLTIPPSALLAIPVGNGKLVVTSATVPQTVSATGLDLGLATAVTTYEMVTSFK